MKGKLFKVPNALSYKGDSKNWHKFKQQFDIYMKATGLINNVSENKVNIFLNIAGQEALEIYNNLKLSNDDKTNFDAVMEAFENHCVSKQNVIYKSFKFFTRIQQPSEVFNDFLNDLQVMADFCNFGDQKDRLIRDRIIAGIRNSELQEKFLKSPDLSLNEVIKRCQDDETVKIHYKNEVPDSDSLENDQNDEDVESNNNFDGLMHDELVAENVYNYKQVPKSEVTQELFFYDVVVEEADYVSNDGNEMNDVQEFKTICMVDDTQSSSHTERAQPEENVVETSRYNRKGKVLARRKRSEAIQNKIAEVKKSLCNTIKKEVNSEQMGIWQKRTRSKIKNVLEDDLDDHVSDEEVNSEQMGIWQKPVRSKIENILEDDLDDHASNEEVNSEQMEIWQEGTQSQVKNILVDELEDHASVEEEQTATEARDPYIYDEETDNEENNCNIEHSIFQEIEMVDCEPGNLNGGNISSIEELSETQYLLEKGVIGLNFVPKKKQSKRGRKPKKNEPKIIKVNRVNLPPLILKSVRKKTLLLGKMPYPCKKCDASFWTTVQLEKHQLVHVLKKDPPPTKSAPKKIFKCEECGKLFKKICDLERHTRVHTGEKPSVCNICNKRFQQAYNLNKHLLIHTQEKNFECVICQKKFGRNDVLNRHVLTHSIDKPFHCTICSKTFIRNSQLNLHRKKYHGGKNCEVTLDDSLAGKSTD